jgi:hypothetical protein
MCRLSLPSAPALLEAAAPAVVAGPWTEVAGHARGMRMIPGPPVDG